MALNLWTTGGKPSSYSPLPTGWASNVISLNPTTQYTVSFYAYSPSGATLEVCCDGGTDINQMITLTTSRKFYTFSFTKGNTNPNQFHLYDYNSKGDITIDSISLVQKPLPKNTINGVDGFLSGKWTFDSHATVQDDQNMVLNATADYQTSYLYIPCLPNQTFTVSFNGNMSVAIDAQDTNKTQITQILSWGNSGRSFTTPANCYWLKFWFSNMTGRGTFTVSQPQLNLGTTPAPFSKKTDPNANMVMPYLNAKGKYQENKIPQRLNTANKGLKMGVGDYVDCGTFLNTALQGSSQFTVDLMINLASLVGSGGSWSWFFTTNDDSGASHSGFYIGNSAYSDGTIVFTCKNISINSTTKLVVGNWYRITASFNNGLISFYVNGVLQGTANTGVSTITMGTVNTRINNAGYYSSPTLKATYQYVRVYNSALTPSQIDSNQNSNVLMNYDFTQPRNLVGNTVIPNAQNLIPHFDSGLWTLDATTKILGKDFLHQDATATTQSSFVVVPASANTNYFCTVNTKGWHYEEYLDSNKNVISGSGWIASNSRNFTTPANTAYIRFYLGSSGAGSFDYIRPQLYQLSGQEGTINGAPILNNKFPKQRLYAKR